MAIDPVCGMSVDEQTPACSTHHAGIIYYFCSADCLRQFEAKLAMIDRLRQGGRTVGVISAVHGPVVDIACDYLPPLHQALFTLIDHEIYILEVYQHLDERHVRAVTLHRTSGLQRGIAVFDSGAPLRVPVSRNVWDVCSISSANHWTAAYRLIRRISGTS